MTTTYLIRWSKLLDAATPVTPCDLRVTLGFAPTFSSRTLSMLKATTAIIVLGLSASAAHAECVKENSEVTVTGKIARETFAGPPNYESIEKGDKAERFWVLTGSEPVEVCAAEARAKGASSGKFQLVLDEKQYQRFASFIGRPVAVKGTAWVAQTGHHHTAVLITVADIRSARVAVAAAAPVATAAPVAALAPNAPAAKDAVAACPARFREFLAKFETDDTFRLEHVQFPLDVKYVDGAAKPEPADRKKQVSRESFQASPWFPSKAEQEKRGLLKRVTEASGKKALVHFDKPDSDAYTVVYHFAKDSSCWQLALVDDRSL